MSKCLFFGHFIPAILSGVFTLGKEWCGSMKVVSKQTKFVFLFDPLNER